MLWPSAKESQILTGAEVNILSTEAPKGSKIKEAAGKKKIREEGNPLGELDSRIGWEHIAL